MPSEASQASTGRCKKNTSQRVSTVYHGDVEASACPGEIHYVAEDNIPQAAVASQAPCQFPDINEAHPVTINPRRPNVLEGSVVNLVFVLLSWIFTKAKQTLSAGFFPASKWCHYLFHCMPEEGAAELSQREYLTRWEAALRAIARSWKDTQSIATSILLVSSLTILQLDDNLNNSAICTLMAASILLALASILSSFAYLLSKERFIGRWKTLEAPNPSFWRCIAMPLDFAIWWALSHFWEQPTTAHSMIPER
ncbi:hypothetical protein D9613_011296 [Agrocybe pediades]|uniref:Transmembrane protein n=1 Tax=Agrocybe pediades TaxID=84607 RepID=A0A8H4VN50_9AGAR|nr:hypothetical protein D9613_011296 [Agrocybe pediades]